MSERCRDSARAILEPHLGADWTVARGRMEWDYRTSVGHVADALAFIAAHLGSSSTEWLKFDVLPHADATSLHLVRLAEAMGGVRGQVIDTASNEISAFAT